MLTKNAYSIGKDFTKVGKSFFDTTNGVSKFQKTLGMMTSPAGIAIGAVGLVTTAVLTYKKHQEEAREALLNMGDSLQKSFDDYHAIDEQTRRTQNLITEYKRLTDKINDSKTPAQDLAEARRKLADTEKELIKLNPDILSAEDAKNGMLSNQLDTLNQINKTTQEISRRDLESQVFDAKDKLPNLVAEYEDMTSKVDDYQKSIIDAEKSYHQFQSYAARVRQLYDTTQPGSEEQRQKEDDLANEILKATGQDYTGRLGQVYKTMEDYKASYNSMRTTLNETEKSIIDAKQSYQQLYDQQVELIQINDLGGEKFSSQAAKYAKMTDEEKKRFEEAASHIRDLNAAMDEMPLSKKIDLSVVWHQTGTIPDYSTPAGKQIKHIELRDPGFNGYADGGRVTSPELAWIGEGGDDEFVIPVNNSKRSRGLYAAAGEALGLSSGGNFAPVFSPTYVIPAEADRKMVESVVRNSQKEWEQNMAAWQRQQQRRNLAQ